MNARRMKPVERKILLIQIEATDSLNRRLQILKKGESFTRNGRLKRLFRSKIIYELKC